jgi:protein SCO1/2
MKKRAPSAFAVFGAVLCGFLINVPAASAGRWGADYFPNVPLTTQDGRKVHFYDDLLKGKRVIINFIFTTCGSSCPLETARLKQVEKILGDHMGRDIFFYSITVDPKHDKPDVLKKYAESYHTGPGWLFLTGNPKDTELIRQKLGQAARAGQNQITDHSTSIMIGNEATGEWIRDGSTDNPQYIATIVRDWFAGAGARESAGNYAQAPALPGYIADRGGYLFHSQCAACHSLGKGDGIAPDLAGVTKHRDPAWLAAFISKPDEMLAKKDPAAMALQQKYKQLRMPNLRLTELDVKAIINYLGAGEAQEKQQ